MPIEFKEQMANNGIEPTGELDGFAEERCATLARLRLMPDVSLYTAQFDLFMEAPWKQKN